MAANMNSKYRRQLARLPQELKTVLDNITDEWTLLSFIPYGPGWEAELRVGGRLFRLNSDYSCIDVGEVKSESSKAIPLLDAQREVNTPKEVADLINSMTAETS
jgi:hypothetical protein